MDCLGSGSGRGLTLLGGLRLPGRFGLLLRVSGGGRWGGRAGALGLNLALLLHLLLFLGLIRTRLLRTRRFRFRSLSLTLLLDRLLLLLAHRFSLLLIRELALP